MGAYEKILPKVTTSEGAQTLETTDGFAVTFSLKQLTYQHCSQ